MTKNSKKYYATGEKNRLYDFLKVNGKRIQKWNHLIHVNYEFLLNTYKYNNRMQKFS